jgi:hypothetical protein
MELLKLNKRDNDITITNVSYHSPVKPATNRGCRIDPKDAEGIMFSYERQTQTNLRITGGLDFFPSSGVLGSRNTTFRKLDKFLSSGEGGRRHLLSWAPQEELISTTKPQ